MFNKVNIGSLISVGIGIEVGIGSWYEFGVWEGVPIDSSCFLIVKKICNSWIF